MVGWLLRFLVGRAAFQAKVLFNFMQDRGFWNVLSDFSRCLRYSQNLKWRHMAYVICCLFSATLTFKVELCLYWLQSPKWFGSLLPRRAGMRGPTSPCLGAQRHLLPRMDQSRWERTRSPPPPPPAASSSSSSQGVWSCFSAVSWFSINPQPHLNWPWQPLFQGLNKDFCAPASFSLTRAPISVMGQPKPRNTNGCFGTEQLLSNLRHQRCSRIRFCGFHVGFPCGRNSISRLDHRLVGPSPSSVKWLSKHVSANPATVSMCLPNLWAHSTLNSHPSSSSVGCLTTSKWAVE